MLPSKKSPIVKERMISYNLKTLTDQNEFLKNLLKNKKNS